MKEFITYEEYGAVGDGVTNDFFAMKRAHIAANERERLELRVEFSIYLKLHIWFLLRLWYF